jgi:hypothetical protein
MRASRWMAAGVLSAGAIIPQLTAVTPAAQAGVTGGGGLTWQYSDTANGYWRQPQSRSSGGGGDTGPATVYVQYGTPGEALQCPRNDQAFMCSNPNNETEGGAGIVGILCGEDVGDRGLPVYPWIRYTREIENGQPTQWYGDFADCTEPGDDDFVEMQDISDQIQADVFELVGKPMFHIAPNNKTLVNLPTVLWTDYPNDPDGAGPGRGIINSDTVHLDSVDPTQVTIDVTVEKPGDDLHGIIVANAEYKWDFEGGPAYGRGKKNTGDDTPTKAEGYTIATFDRAGETQTITLTATWTGRVTVDGLVDEAIVPVPVEWRDEIEVDQAKSVIVR